MPNAENYGLTLLPITADKRGGHQTERENVTCKLTLEKFARQTLNKKSVDNLIVVSADSFAAKQKSIIVGPFKTIFTKLANRKN